MKKIISWNVNGIRACYKKGMQDFLNKEKPDYFCIQETKAHIEQVENNIKTLGFTHHEWSSAKKKGYSGVASFSRISPKSTEKGISIEAFDSEGRFVISKYPEFWLYNIYFPNGAASEERHLFKQDFLSKLNTHLKPLLNTGQPLVVVGDYNVARTAVDVYDPVRLAKASGFLPEERQWFERFLELGFTDTFRHLHPNEKNRYSWWSYREFARVKNNGWRIDYICVSNNLKDKIKKADILDTVEGSDHCPIVLELDL